MGMVHFLGNSNLTYRLYLKEENEYYAINQRLQ